MGVILRRRMFLPRTPIRARAYKVVEQFGYEKGLYQIERVTKYKGDEKDLTKRVRYGVLCDGEPLGDWWTTRQDAIDAAERHARQFYFRLRDNQADHRYEMGAELGLSVNQAIRKARRKKAQVG